jgi:hypothetical protein
MCGWSEKNRIGYIIHPLNLDVELLRRAPEYSGVQGKTALIREARRETHRT